MLFTACLEEVFKLLDWEGLGVRINGEYLSNLRFADDIVLFSNNGDELQQMIEDLNRESVRVGLKINMQKTKIMFYSLAREQEFRIASQPLESVKEYVYLGQLLTGDPDHEKEIYRRIKLGWSAYGRHYQILTGRLHCR